MNLVVNSLKLKSKDTYLILAFAVLLCAFIAFMKEFIFPEKYFFDSFTIQNLIEHPYKDTGDQAFVNTAKFFNILHIDRYVWAPIIAIVTYFFSIILLFKKYNVELISFNKFLLMVAYSAMAMVYMSTYSKDLVLFLIIIIPFTLLEKKHLFLWALFVVFYAWFFRSYWFITLAVFFILKYFAISKPKFLLLTIVCYYVAISFVYNYIFGTSLSMVRYLTNLDRDAESAQTAIAIFIKGSNFFIEAANFLVTLFFLVIPIPLLLLAKPFYIILALLIIVFFYNFIKLYIKEYHNKKYTNIFSFVVAFMLVQSLFEPDYGSFVRHLAPLYPLIFVCIAKNTKPIEDDEVED